MENSFAPPCINRSLAHSELFCQLFGGEEPAIVKALLVSLRSSCVKNPTKAGERERITSSRAEAALLENVDGLPLGVMIEEHIDLRQHLLWGLAYLPRIQRQRDSECGRGATPESNVRDDVAITHQSDILDEECEHALAVQIRGLKITPECGQICIKSGLLSWILM